jgi:subtilisin-like proprotein convertase family protein
MLALGFMFGTPSLLDGQADDPPLLSSLQLGEPHDPVAQQKLREQVEGPLIKLQSRFVVPDASCPLEPSQPFYVRFHEPLGRELHDDLLELGVQFVGYAKPRTYTLRLSPGADAATVRALLRDHPNVAGTALMHAADRYDAVSWLARKDLLQHGGRIEALFWGDTTPPAAEALLSRANAHILEASVDPDGRMNLHTRYVLVDLSAEGFAVIDGSPLVEFIHLHLGFTNDNVGSTELSNASATDVGPGTSYNLDGTGVIVGVWDNGPARSTHDDFQTASGSRIIVMDSTNHAYHGTHVTGTIVGSGASNPEARGYAPAATALGFDWNNMAPQRREARHTHRIATSNHSYGLTGVTMGGYHARAQESDQDLRDMLMLMTQSAGNSGNGSTTIGSDKGMKNAFVIGSTNNSGSISGFSSRGPALDGRLQPQFTAKGGSVTSTSNSGDDVHGTSSGTSMSSPSVNGSLTLLTQLWQREHPGMFFPPDVARAVLALTADDRYHEGPDYRFGFGIVDAKAAADLILADKQSGGRNIVRGTIRQDDEVEYTMTVSSAAEPLLVTLAWLDIHASTNASIILVNDLDIELVSPLGSTFYPYSGRLDQGAQTYEFTTTGPNRRDNTLLTRVENPEVGEWTVRVIAHEIPLSPQAGVPNASTGFVLASNRAVDREFVFVADALNTSGPVAIPDNNVNGISRTFNVSDNRVVGAIRVLVDITHERRGDIDIRLIAPDGTSARIEGTNSSTRRDIIGVYPDTRQYNDDTAMFHRRAAGGTWTVTVSDRTADNTGTLEYLAIEIDFEDNEPPVADAGQAQTVRAFDPVTLNATGTYDPEGDHITYLWTQTAGPSVTLNADDTPITGFVAPAVAASTVLTFQLTATDLGGAQGHDFVSITVNPNQDPLADAGPDQAAIEGDIVQLDGTGTTDPEGDPMTYSWAQVGGSISVTLSGSSSLTPTFTVPPIAAGDNETLVFELTAQDDRDGVGKATVNVLVQHNLPPRADAGSNFAVA